MELCTAILPSLTRCSVPPPRLSTPPTPHGSFHRPHLLFPIKTSVPFPRFNSYTIGKGKRKRLTSNYSFPTPTLVIRLCLMQFTILPPLILTFNFIHAKKFHIMKEEEGEGCERVIVLLLLTKAVPRVMCWKTAEWFECVTNSLGFSWLTSPAQLIGEGC